MSVISRPSDRSITAFSPFSRRRIGLKLKNSVVKLCILNEFAEVPGPEFDYREEVSSSSSPLGHVSIHSTLNEKYINACLAFEPSSHDFHKDFYAQGSVLYMGQNDTRRGWLHSLTIICVKYIKNHTAILLATFEFALRSTISSILPNIFVKNHLDFKVILSA